MSDEAIPQPQFTPAQEFQIGLFRNTPRVFVTQTLIALNIAVFVLMALNGVSLLEPTTASLIHWGADYGPLTTHGQWWRLLTSAFVHIGIIHILMNMYVLYTSGLFVERLYGNTGFAVLYLLAGIGGNLVSVAWHPATVAAGASGAVFGVYGGLFAFLIRQRSAIPANTVSSLFRNGLIFLGYNLVYGAAKSGIDVSAHLGGLVSGFLVGCVLALPLSASRDDRFSRAVLVSIAGLAICAACAWKLPRVDDLEAAIKQFDSVEKSSLKLINDSLDQMKADKLTPQQFSDAIHQQVLPPWDAERGSLEKLNLVGAQKTFMNKVIQYMDLRGEAWSDIADGVAQNNRALMEQSKQKTQEAMNLMKSADQ